MAEQLEYSISLESLKLENFRCFDNLEINFEEKLTVFIAQNGGGKTTLLDAVTENLKTYLSALGIDGYKPKPIAFKDIKEGELSARCEISPSAGCRPTP